MQIRRRARIVAIQSLFEIDMTGHNPAIVLAQRLEQSPLAEAGAQFAHELVHGVLQYKPHLDEIIQQIAPEWPVDQLAIIDRNILRMAIYEIMVADKTPVKVAINEAVELAKLFGSESSPRFINGVLGTLIKDRDKYQIHDKA